MSRRRIAVVVVGIAALVAIAACGSGAGGGGASSPEAVGGGRYGDAPATPASSSGAPAAGGACTASTATATVQVSIAERAFTPDTVKAKVGDSIAFTNADAVPHTATLDDGSCSTENLGKDQTGSLTFSAPGTYSFHCKIHAGMTGSFEITS
jgi:plastocyanin